MPDSVLQVPAGGRLLYNCPGSNNATKVYFRTRLMPGTQGNKGFWAGLAHGALSSSDLIGCIGGERKRYAHPGGQMTFGDYPFWVNGGYPGGITARKNILVLDLDRRVYSHVAIWVAVGGNLTVAQADIATWQ